MKRVVPVVCVLVCCALFTVTVASARMETVKGKVTAVDPGGKAIVVVKGSGYGAYTSGAIVGQDTIIKVKGKKASLSGIKAGDKVTVKLLRSDNLYAKQIIKK